jgi:hypothetical protein
MQRCLIADGIRPRRHDTPQRRDLQARGGNKEGATDFVEPARQKVTGCKRL